ncbi:MAG: twin-arginine translocase subunit TatC [Aristaeellaceae bacterium]
MNQDKNKQSLLTHLAALRKVLIVSAAAILIAFALVFYTCIDQLMSLLVQPIVDRGIEIIYTAMSEALVTKLKVAIIAGVVLASPVVIWQIWSFVAPALYPKEKRTVTIVFAIMVVLFLLGVTFCYGAVYLLAVDFFLVSGENLATPMLSIDKYIGFLFGFVVPFGVAFELPVILYITSSMGLTNYQMLASKRKYIILGVVVVAAVLTPPDVVSQVMLAIPILLLFEIGLLITRLVHPRTDKAEE